VILLVCGGRTFNDYDLVLSTLSNLRPVPKLLIHGGAPGADTLAQEAADFLEIPTQAFPADWEAFGFAAGPRRNEQMIRLKPDLVIAFKGGKGTDDMIRRAKRAKIRVLYPGS
jgi:hypothetical protein